MSGPVTATLSFFVQLIKKAVFWVAIFSLGPRLVCKFNLFSSYKAKPVGFSNNLYRYQYNVSRYQYKKKKYQKKNLLLLLHVGPILVLGS